MIDSSYGYELRLWQVQSLLVPSGGVLQVPIVTSRLSWVTSAEVQLLQSGRLSKSDGTVVTVYGRGTVTAGSRCEVQLSRVTGAHRMMSTCVEILWTEPVIWWVTSAQSAQLHMRHYLYVLSKVATSDHMTKKVIPMMPSNTNWDHLSTIIPHPPLLLFWPGQIQHSGDEMTAPVVQH